jgi:hypothetical protein
MAKSVKLSKTTRWVLTIGILAMLLITAGVVYSRQKAEESELSGSIARTRLELIKYEPTPAVDKEELERRLAEASSSIAGLEAEFRRYTESIEISEELVAAAGKSGVSITRLGSSGRTGELVNGIPCRVFTLTVAAQADLLPSLINFSTEISRVFPAATIESVAVHVGQDNKATMDLGLKIYSYE